MAHFPLFLPLIFSRKKIWLPRKPTSPIHEILSETFWKMVDRQTDRSTTISWDFEWCADNVGDEEQGLTCLQNIPWMHLKASLVEHSLYGDWIRAMWTMSPFRIFQWGHSLPTFSNFRHVMSLIGIQKRTIHTSIINIIISIHIFIKKVPFKRFLRNEKAFF